MYVLSSKCKIRKMFGRCMSFPVNPLVCILFADGNSQNIAAASSGCKNSNLRVIIKPGLINGFK